MANMFNEDGTYNKTEWKAGDKITANKLNKIEASLEAINNNDIFRHLEADNRLDILEEKAAASSSVDNERVDDLEDAIQANKDAVELAVYEINSGMASLDNRINNAVDSVNVTTNSLSNDVSALRNDISSLQSKDNETSLRLNNVENDISSLFYIQDNESIQTAIDRAVSSDFATLVLKPQRYMLTAPIILDISRMKINGNGAVLDFSSAPDNISCIQLTASKSSPYYQNGNYLKELEIVGKGGESGQIAIDFVSATAHNAVSHVNLEKLNIHHFNVGVKYTSYCYLIRHLSVDIFSCNTCVYMPNGGADYGENILFVGCAFYNSGVAVNNQNPNGSFRLTNCSIDYNNTCIISDGGHVFFDNGHIEGLHEYVCTSTDGSYISVTNSTLVMNDTDASHTPFKADNDMLFANNFIAGGRFGSAYRDNLISGNGMVEFTGSKSYGICDFFTHTFSNNNSVRHTNHYQTRIREAYDVVDKWTSKALNISIDPSNSVDGSSNALMVKSDYGQGSYAAFEVYIPVSSERFSINYAIKSSVDIAEGAMAVTMKYADVCGYDEKQHGYLAPCVMDSISIGDSKPGVSTTYTRKYSVTSSARKPKKYNMVILDFNLFYCNACTIWIDDIRVTEF